MTKNALLAGCGGGGDYEAVKGSFVGKVDGTNAMIGLVSDGKHVLAYACDNEQLFRWFNGSTENGRFASNGGTLRLQATLTAAGVKGTLRLEDGTSHPFELEPARGRAGLYRGETVRDQIRYVGGAVVLASGARRGGSNAVPVINEATDVGSISLAGPIILNGTEAGSGDLGVSAPAGGTIAVSVPGRGTFKLELQRVT